MGSLGSWKLTAKDNIILVSHIVGESWLEVCGPKYKRIRMSAFTKTGIALTITGSNDNTVICEGMRFPVELVPAGQAFTDKEYLAQAWSLDDKFYEKKVVAAAALGAGPAHVAIEDKPEDAEVESELEIEEDEQGLNSSDEDEQGEDSSSSLSLDGEIVEVLDDGLMLADLVLGGLPVNSEEDELFG